VTTDVVAHYTVTDKHGKQSTADLTITLTGVNDAPVVTIVTPGAGTNLIQNGSFEDGPAFIGNAGGHVAPWVPDGSVDYISWSLGGESAWQAADGDRSLDMSGESPGSISQSFATVAGMQYTVHFSLAGNPFDTLHLLRVSAGSGTEQIYQFDAPGHSAADMGWTGESYTFTATGATTTLSFASIENETTGNDFAGPALDNVSVVQAASPSPRTRRPG
jgi:choice-of-anchor C domain-containing protein